MKWKSSKRNMTQKQIQTSYSILSGTFMICIFFETRVFHLLCNRTLLSYVLGSSLQRWILCQTFSIQIHPAALLLALLHVLPQAGVGASLGVSALSPSPNALLEALLQWCFSHIPLNQTPQIIKIGVLCNLVLPHAVVRKHLTKLQLVQRMALHWIIPFTQILSICIVIRLDHG